MLNFEFKSATEVVYGKDTEMKSGELLKKYGGHKALIHHSGEPFVIPLIDRVKKSLEDAGIEYMELGGVVPNPRLSLCYEGIDMCKQNGIDCILAVGGGSVMDSAKCIALGAAFDGDVWDLYLHKYDLPDRLPLGCIVTMPATGSEASWATVITNEETQLKRSIDDNRNRPEFAILNPELTYTLPLFQTQAGIVDAMTHTIERYFSPIKKCDLSDEFTFALLRCAMKNGRILMENPHDYDARGEIMMVALYAQNGLSGQGKDLMGDWASHLIEHEASTEWDIAHGAGLAVIMPAWMRYVYKHDIPLFARFAVNVFGIPYDFDDPERTAIQGIDALEAYWRDVLQMPVTFRDLQKVYNIPEISDETLRKMAQRIYYDPEHRLGQFVRLTEEDCYNIYQNAR